MVRDLDAELGEMWAHLIQQCDSEEDPFEEPEAATLELDDLAAQLRPFSHQPFIGVSFHGTVS